MFVETDLALRFIRGHWVRRPTLSCWDWGRILTCQHLFDNVVKSALLLCANLHRADYISLHCKISFYKWSLLQVILTWEISLYLLDAVFESEKCTGTVIVSASFFLFAKAIFLSSLGSSAFGITDSQYKSLRSGKVSNNKYCLLHIYFLFFS